jgi:single-strand DNA-binding protein
MSFDVTGKLHKKYPTENKTDSFQTREFVIVVESGNYPQYVKFQMTQDRCAIIDPFEEGQEVKVHFDLRGREWNDKYFTNLNAWRIEAGGQPSAAAPASTEGNFFPTADDEPGSAAADDDLPF